MKKFLSAFFITLFLFNTSFTFAKSNITKQEKIDAFTFLVDKKIIQKSEKFRLNKFISKAEFWKISLLTAGYVPKPKNQLFKTPIKWVKSNVDYSQYALISYKNWLLDKYKWKVLNPDYNMRKLESLEFTFKLFWISTPMFNDLIMDFKDVKNDESVVSKCLQIWLCDWETFFIFWANKPITKIEAYNLLFKAYNFVYNWENINSPQKWWIPLIDEIYSTIINEYYKADELSSKELIYWAAKWMADSVWDKYTTFMPPVKSKIFNEDLSWSFQWIWAYVEKEKSWIRIVTPINWWPAKKAWLKSGDLIFEINGKNVVDFALSEVISLIKWPEWTFVKIKIKRWNSYLNFKIKREKIIIPSVQSIVENWILILSVNQFWQKTYEEIRAEIEKNDEINSIIFDLRNNPWGYLWTTQKILSMFVENWKDIIKIKYPKSVQSVKSSPLIKKINWKKIVILINKSSASASEIFAWTMQDYKLAKIIWSKSYWKWTVQTIMQFVDGSQFKYTIANWLTWKWNAVDWIWIIPDLKVENNPEKMWDEVMKKAKKMFMNFD